MGFVALFALLVTAQLVCGMSGGGGGGQPGGGGGQPGGGGGQPGGGGGQPGGGGGQPGGGGGQPGGGGGQPGGGGGQPGGGGGQPGGGGGQPGGGGGQPGGGGGKPGGGFGPPGGDYGFNIPNYAIPYLTGRGGRNGRDGEKGIKGLKGENGEKGYPGPKSAYVGDPGDKGYKGYKGEPGWVGEKGYKGEIGFKGMKGAEGELLAGGGSTYINWGSDSCTSPAELVYAGYAVAPTFDNAGGGAQYLCIDLDDIDPGNLAVNTVTPMSSVVGVHFETFADPSDFQFGDTVNHEEPLDDLDGMIVRCAMCLTHNTDVMVVPNSQTCPLGDMEYTGYLMAARDYIYVPNIGINQTPVFLKNDATNPTHFRTEYICVNLNPVAAGTGPTAMTEGLLAHTRIFCRDLLGLFDTGCSPFIGDDTCLTNSHCALGPLGCAVCSIPPPT